MNMFFFIFPTILMAQIYSHLEIARDWHERVYLPALTGSVLYVGVGQYTQSYYRLTQTPELFETIDFLPQRAEYGSPYRHYVADFLTFDPGYCYDHLSLFGIMGHPPSIYYSIVDDLTIAAMIKKADQLLKVGGTLELGPNHVSAPGQTKEFWLHLFTLPPLNQYKTLFLGVGIDNIVWWGCKVSDSI